MVLPHARMACSMKSSDLSDDGMCGYRLLAFNTVMKQGMCRECGFLRKSLTKSDGSRGFEMG